MLQVMHCDSGKHELVLLKGQCPFCKIDEMVTTSFEIQERLNCKVNFYQAQMFQSWKALKSQNKGMNRMARKIKRLQAQVKALETYPPMLLDPATGTITPLRTAEGKSDD